MPPRPDPDRRPIARHLALAVVLLGPILASAAIPPRDAAPRDAPRQDRDPDAPTTLPRAHDPAIAREGDTYYLFTTGRGIILHTSDDLVTWRRRGRVLDPPPAWNAETIPGWNRDHWAPDIAFFHGRWHLYYCVSLFGKNLSAIGLATTPTLDPDRPDYRWEDRGIVFQTRPGDDYNALDPNLVLDESGRPWLAFGSYWSGLKLLALDPATGKPAEDEPKLYPLAGRPEPPHAIEAPFLIRRGDYYYLFASFDQCCQGVRSTYNLRVGRSRSLTGPYLDRDGVPLLEGGGTLLREGAGRWRGPGHNAILRDGDTHWLLYHAYDADDRGLPKLRIEALRWDDSAWPVPTGRPPGAAADD